VKPSTERPRTAAITGAGSGLGREIALKLAAKGYQVFGGEVASWPSTR
jgi:NAD(P)-dependent dehydrogenase (short-subunit alcohol dehydrogenase family)